MTSYMETKDSFSLRIRLHWREIESDITSRWVVRESNLMFTLISDKDQRKNRLRDRLV